MQIFKNKENPELGFVVRLVCNLLPLLQCLLFNPIRIRQLCRDLLPFCAAPRPFASPTRPASLSSPAAEPSAD